MVRQRLHPALSPLEQVGFSACIQGFSEPKASIAIGLVLDGQMSLDSDKNIFGS